jgi:hypothetical protein
VTVQVGIHFHENSVWVVAHEDLGADGVEQFANSVRGRLPLREAIRLQRQLSVSIEEAMNRGETL